MAIDTIKSSAITDGTIATGDIANDAVTGTKLANDINIAGDLTVSGNDINTAGLMLLRPAGTEIVRINDTGDVIVKGQGNNRGMLVLRAGSNTANSQLRFGDQASDLSGRILYDHSDDTMRFDTNGSERVRISAAGLAIGGTGAANTLDDYEEGSWTPVCGTPGVTGSYSVQLGRYIKVGNFCHVIFNLTINSAYTGSTSASFTIGGLPFATKAYDASLYAGGHIGYYFNVDHTNNNQTLVYQIPSGSSLTMELKGVGDAIGEQIVRPSMMGTNAVIRGSISYHTA